MIGRSGLDSKKRTKYRQLKLRTNHQRVSDSGSIVHRVIIFLGLVVLLILLTKSIPYILNHLSKGAEDELQSLNDEDGSRFYLPLSGGEVVHHSYYSLSYIEKHELSEWVCYELTRESLRLPRVPRHNWFDADPKVKTLSAVHADFNGSGYDRGHLVPAADMAFSDTAMKETFYMSNITPQVRQFNNGIWRELEEQVRDWAFKSGRVIVVSGPILTKGIRGKIGRNGVSVPSYFYKIVLNISSEENDAIAFIIPNELSEKPLQEYAVTIDSVEVITGIDFFAELFNPALQEKIESNIDLGKWRFSESRYKLRVEKWNKQ